MVTDVPLNNNLTARLIGSPVKLSAVQFKVRHSPPDLGQDTHNILQEYGFDDSQIKAMKDQGDLDLLEMVKLILSQFFQN